VLTTPLSLFRPRPERRIATLTRKDLKEWRWCITAALANGVLLFFLIPVRTTGACLLILVHLAFPFQMTQYVEIINNKEIPYGQ
jgi:hypothetical protein